MALTVLDRSSDASGGARWISSRLRPFLRSPSTSSHPTWSSSVSMEGGSRPIEYTCSTHCTTSFHPSLTMS